MLSSEYTDISTANRFRFYRPSEGSPLKLMDADDDSTWMFK